MSVKKVPMGKKTGPYIPYFLSQRDCEAWNRIIQKSGRAIETWTKLRAKMFEIFCIANYT